MNYGVPVSLSASSPVLWVRPFRLGYVGLTAFGSVEPKT
jgi:hypothetical protein